MLQSRPRSTHSTTASAPAALLRELSVATDPAAMCHAFINAVRQQLHAEALVLLTREGVPPPNYRLTWVDLTEDVQEHVRYGSFSTVLQPSGSLFDRLWESAAPETHDLAANLDDDLAGIILEGYGGLLSLPLFEQGRIAAVLLLLRRSGSFRRRQVPAALCVANFVGRALYDQNPRLSKVA